MLCALVAYYFLSVGGDDHALHWKHLEICLFQALEYVDNRAEYQQWRKEQLDSSARALDAEAEAIVGDDDRPANIKGGTVRSLGSSIKVKPGTTLAQLMGALGRRAQLLDEIPDTPITISPQTIYPSYFPFRLHLGTYSPLDAVRPPVVNVYVYFTQNGTIRIHGHGTDSKVFSWKLNRLQDVQLFAPFAPFIRVTNLEPLTQGNKIRNLIYYYFMLAENEGFIGALQLKVYQGLVQSLCSACNTLQMEGHNLHLRGLQGSGGSSDGFARDMASGGVSEEIYPELNIPTTNKKSLIAKLRLNPVALAEIAGDTTASQRADLPGSETGQVAMLVDDSEQGEEDTNPEFPAILFGESVEPPRAVPHNNPNPDMALGSDSTDLGHKKKSETLCSDNGFDSSSASPFMPLTSEISVPIPNHSYITTGEVGASTMSIHTLDSETTHEKSGQASRQRLNSLVTRTPSDRRRAVSVISIRSVSSISSCNDSEYRPVNEQTDHNALRPALNTSIRQPPMFQAHVVDVIDLCSDDDDDPVFMGSAKREGQETSDAQAFLHVSRPRDGSGSDRSNKVPPPGTKRKVAFLSGVEEDGMVEEIGGDEWRRASWSRSQTKRSGPHS
ncbi:uncharacterized protein K460DRAFT_30626 [Cucurbitaria berberidis CBS 394.84]|uniref:Uncharacterized protein n=1 Tax=Cucurbitaria berberidis CBS 394.84 TaxID=1168544 RepID=A0A9P4LED7_9PLEO|nr:uncharacterized protein K460DRAFT_30626 [Cucurbitaria berberidis CBS 394.84]KAF1851272.1 hypothetical protein K460DRAFT_30626 [Cucurbitaria berberidis CBS 394.84]